MRTHHTHAGRAPLAAATLMLAVACGGAKHQAADSTATAAAADTSSRLAPPVGSSKPAMDSGVAKGNETIDSLKKSGETPASGIAKGVQPAAHASTNDSSPKAHELHAKPTNVP
jgi:hypothetical protein